MWHDTFGLSEQSAMNLLRQDGLLPTSDEDRVVSMFRDTFGLSESAARRAVEVRSGPPLRSVSDAGRSWARPKPGDGLRLVAKIEELAGDRCGRGESKEAALRAAFYRVLDAVPDSSKDWVAGVAGRRWPELFGSQG
jgi:hypothetical protein